MQMLEVKDKKTAKQFLDVARRIYRDEPNWVCPLDNDIHNIFDPDRNAFFKNGEAVRWILKDDDGSLIGRVAAFYNKAKALKYAQPTGGMGFFECIDDEKAALMLFKQCESWLSEKGMEAMDGPINFEENLNYWGLLVEGFTLPAFGMNYHHPYYRHLFESYGFRPFYSQITKHLDLTVPFPDRFWKIARWVMKKPGFEFLPFSFENVDKLVDDVKEIYDQAWIFHEHFVPLDKKVIRKIIDSARPILVEDFIWFVYHNKKPIGFFVMFPDINQIIKRFNGKLNIFNKLRFLYYRKIKTMTRARILLLGIVPQYQGQGIESAIFWHLQEPVLVKRPYIKELEISWVGDFNPKMQATLEALGANPGKKHITFRKMFGDELNFKYSRKIAMDTKFRKSNSDSA